MKNFRFTTYTATLNKLGISYLGGAKHSAKLTYSYNNGWLTYGIYLAPATLARDINHPTLNVCPFSDMCRESCLNGAGHNKYETIAMRGKGLSPISLSRIKKTHLFYDNRDLFMALAIHEIKKFQKNATDKGMGFAIRLNCTSDLSPELFKLNGKNILEMFPNVQFYDYTKVPSRLALAEKYDNYHIVFSYDGTNWETCKEWLDKGGQVAVVFDLFDGKKQVLPNEWNGYKVIDANETDTRFLDPKGCIMGLHYHRVANDYKNGKYIPTDTPFIVREAYHY